MIASVYAGLVAGKLDQRAPGTFEVVSAVGRAVRKEQLAPLAERLATWQSAVGGALAAVEAQIRASVAARVAEERAAIEVRRKMEETRTAQASEDRASSSSSMMRDSMSHGRHGDGSVGLLGSRMGSGADRRLGGGGGLGGRVGGSRGGGARGDDAEGWGQGGAGVGGSDRMAADDGLDAPGGYTSSGPGGWGGAGTGGGGEREGERARARVGSDELGERDGDGDEEEEEEEEEDDMEGAGGGPGGEGGEKGAKRRAVAEKRGP